MSGGTTMFANINQRLSKEVTDLTRNTKKAKAFGPSVKILTLDRWLFLLWIDGLSIHLYLVKIYCSLAFLKCFFEIEDVLL